MLRPRPAPSHRWSSWLLALASRRPGIHGTAGWSTSAPGVPRSGVATSRHRRWPGRAAHPRPSAHGGGAVDRGRRQPQGGLDRAGHSSVSFTLDRYGHLYPEADTALRDCLDALYGAGQLGRAAASAVRAWPQCGPPAPTGTTRAPPMASDDALTCDVVWWARQGLNPWPLPCQQTLGTAVLTAILPGRV
jgi:hypothetical protein